MGGISRRRKLALYPYEVIFWRGKLRVGRMTELSDGGIKPVSRLGGISDDGKLLLGLKGSFSDSRKLVLACKAGNSDGRKLLPEAQV